MTSEALELALGHHHTFEYSRESDHIHRVSGRKRRTLHWTSSNRPLHVSQVEVREAKGIRAGKRALLVLYGDAVALLSGSVLESTSSAAAAAGGGGDVTSDHVPALRFLEYSEVISIIPRSSDSIEIEHVVAEDKPKLAVGNLLEVLNEQQQQQGGAGSESDTESSSSSNTVIVNSSSSNNISSSSTVISAVSGSTRVTYATLVLGFHNAAAAQAAAAVLLYYRGQAAAAVHWLSEGLHLGFKCQLAAAEALPLSSSSSSSRGSTMWRAVSIARRSSAGHGGSSSGFSSKPPSTAANVSSSSSSSAVRYQWICQPGLDWGCQVPLPQRWEGFVTSKPDLRSRNVTPLDHSHNAPSGPAAAAAAAAAAARPGSSAAAEKDITLDDLMCRSDLDQGPQALVISFTTPYGLAQATITPQIVRAAVLNSECRQVLAVPVLQDSSSSSGSRSADQAAPVVGFPLKITTKIGSSSSSSSSATGIGTSAVLSRFKAAAAAPAAAGSSAIDYESQVYAALTIQVVQTPQTAGTPAAVRPLNPFHQPPQQQQQQQQQVPATPTPTAAAAAPTVGTGSSSGSKTAPQQVAMKRLGSRMPSMAPLAAASGLTPRQLQLVRLSLYILLAALFCSSSSSTGQLSGIVLLQLLVLLLVAAADLAPLWQQQFVDAMADSKPLQQSQPTAAAAARSYPSDQEAQSSNSSSSGSGAAGGGGVTLSTPTSAFAAVATAGTPFIKDQTPAAAAAAAAAECPTSAGWSLILIEGDVTLSPGPFLQLQIAALSCDQQTADLRAQLSTTRSGSVADLAAPAAAAAAAAGGVQHGAQKHKAGQQLPMLLSDPEPAWLDEDTKLRFINAKPTLEASRIQAGQTDEWRRLKHVDTIFSRPAPFFDTIEKLLPFYTLDKTDEGHAVVFVKLGALKQLSDAVFVTKPPVITLDDLEMHLTLINEYLTKIAAPGPLPAGNQVLLFDLGGMKLSHVMNNDAFALFQVLLKFGTFYPEHLHQAIIMHAPAWFNIPWKMVATFLDANTRSKIMVIGSPKLALKQLSRYLRGVEHVPVEWGGQCTTPLDEFPAHKKMLDFVAKAGY